MGSHGHSGAASEQRATQLRALVVALWANGAFMVVEAAGGLAFHSLALLADAAHMLSDVVALTVAVVAHRLSDRPASARHSYGLQRAEVLGAQFNGLVLLGAAVWIGLEALHRLDTPQQVRGGGLVVVAALGLVVNIASAVLLARARGASLNMRGALVHMLSDALGSVAAIVAGVAALAWHAFRVDPAASLVIAVLVVWSGLWLLRESARVLMEAVPRGIDPAAVARLMTETPGVQAVHDLHVWNLASDVPALSAHVVLAGEVSLHEGQERAAHLKALLCDRFGIAHATLEVECCADADHACSAPEAPAGATGYDAEAGG